MPKYKVRRAQAVVPFGVGAIIDFEQEALMSAGLDAWPDEAIEPLYDDRFAARLGIRNFRQPPAPEGQNRGKLPFVRFPNWHFCPRCRGLQPLRGSQPRLKKCANPDMSPLFFDKEGKVYRKELVPCGKLKPFQQKWLVPARFVVGCDSGHIEDFPWELWAHSKSDEGATSGLDSAVVCKSPKVYFYATSTGGLSGLRVECGSCGKVRTMMGSTNATGIKGFRCSGKRPWLGEDADEVCGALSPPRGLQRGASNVYFANLQTSLLIPPFSKVIRARIDDADTWDQLSCMTEQGVIPEAPIRMLATAWKVNFQELLSAVRLKENGEGLPNSATTEEEYRYAEFVALNRKNESLDDHLITVPQDPSTYEDDLSEFLDRIVLVESVAETRALVGFSRITPKNDPAEMAALSIEPKNWRPAFRVMGEGIFLSFRRTALRSWSEELGTGLDELVERGRNDVRTSLQVTREFIALHTLAHLLIVALSFEAGYSASSIRERIYAAPDDSETPMAGILLYTAAGDSEGTMGGLVRLGKPQNLQRVFARALDRARWCSADPICRESQGQGIDSVNLAACHACSLLPETSCEFGNRWLDRMAVVGHGDDFNGRIERPGFLRNLVEQAEES